MINIRKLAEPDSLTTYRAAGGKFDGPGFTPDVKNGLRTSLLKEQGYLCAYCMQRIHDQASVSKIEHWHSQDSYPHEDLEYKNLLGCCKGGEGQAPINQHCDTAKGKKNIEINPSNPADRVEEQITYMGDGIIRSGNKKIESAITILNLNRPLFVKNRKAEWMAVQQVLGSKSGSRTKSEVEKLIVKYDEPGADGKLHPYCGVGRYFLRKRLNSGQRP
ncbi:MAG: TIGR02646 family protein [Bacteroidia bacterium]|nr:TIGR02646 family protein [Bacteroidia bacterium]